MGEQQRQQFEYYFGAQDHAAEQPQLLRTLGEATFSTVVPLAANLAAQGLAASAAVSGIFRRRSAQSHAPKDPAPTLNEDLLGELWADMDNLSHRARKLQPTEPRWSLRALMSR